MLRYFVLLSLLRSVASSSVSIAGPERELLSVVCPGGEAPRAYYDIEVDMNTPDGVVVDPTLCTDAKKESLGNALNVVLLQYGSGTTTDGETVDYLAHVCIAPETMTRGRKLLKLGYRYRGYGKCDGCWGDSSDERRLQIFDPNWFENTYKLQLEEILTDAIMSDVAPNHQDCLASVPEVLVVVTAVSQSQVETTCAPTKNPGCCTWGNWDTCAPWTFFSDDIFQQSPENCEGKGKWGTWIYEGCCTWPGLWTTCPQWTITSTDSYQQSPTQCEGPGLSGIWLDRYDGCCTWGQWSTCPVWTITSDDSYHQSPDSCESGFGTWIWGLPDDAAPAPAPAIPKDQWVLSTTTRCGSSEADARGKCGPTCSTNNDCSTGENCWSVYGNYCDSKPQPLDCNGVFDTQMRCGASELLARETCGAVCQSAFDCGGEYCFPIHKNYCEC